MPATAVRLQVFVRSDGLPNYLINRSESRSGAIDAHLQDTRYDHLHTLCNSFAFSRLFRED